MAKMRRQTGSAGIDKPTQKRCQGREPTTFCKFSSLVRMRKTWATCWLPAGSAATIRRLRRATIVIVIPRLGTTGPTAVVRYLGPRRHCGLAAPRMPPPLQSPDSTDFFFLSPVNPRWRPQILTSLEFLRELTSLELRTQPRFSNGIGQNRE